MRSATEADIEAWARLESNAFGFPKKGAADWLKACELQNVRLADHAGQVAGACIFVPMGQYFGGRRVSMTGFAGVAVAPFARRRGVGSGLMTNALRELHSEGVGLSMLYASNQPLYRAVGFEQAGTHVLHNIHPRDIACAERALDARWVEPSDDEALRALYTEVAQQQNGRLARGEYVWGRQQRNGDARLNGFAVEGDAGLRGYVLYTGSRGAQGEQVTTKVRDFVAGDLQAARRLWTLLADHSATVDRVQFGSGPGDPLLLAMPGHPAWDAVLEYSMSRVVHLPTAIAERGYGRHLELDVCFELLDAQLPENQGCWRLLVGAGEGRVERCEGAEVKLDVRALSALYTGHQGSRALRMAGLLEGPGAQAALLDAAFAGPPPWASEMF